MLSKADLRAFIKQKTQRLTAQQKNQQSASVLHQLATHPRFVAAHTILLFHSLPDEVDTHAFIKYWSQQKQILLPVVDHNKLIIKCYTSDEQMQQGAFHISEPIGNVFTTFTNIDLIVVPGIAFDADGHRLGRGKGFYDRLLSAPSLQHTYKIGLCLPHQLIEQVPTEPHDVLMNEVIA